MSIILFGLPYLFQLLLIVHAIRNGRDTTWVWLIIFVPYVGGVAYIVIELLPELTSRRRLGAVMDIVARTVSPGRALDERKARYEFSKTQDNAKALADEYLERGYFDEALGLYAGLLEGRRRVEPEFLLGMAKAQYGKGDYEEAARLVSRLEESGWEWKRERDILVKLRIAEHLLPEEEVEALYRKAKNDFRSFEILYYNIQYLAGKGQAQAALDEISEIEDLTRQLRRDRIAFDRRWANRALRLRAKLQA